MLKAVICGPIATQSGYGHHAREIADNLIKQTENEWDVKLLSMPWGGTPFTYPISDDWKQRIIPLPLQFQPDVWVQVTVPNEFQPLGKMNIGVTAGTEGDVCPVDWIEKINAMQIVIVPSVFTKDVFLNTARANNLEIKCDFQVVPEYFDSTIYSNEVANVEIKELDSIPETFAFLSVGHWLSGQIGEDRKNVTGVIHTFYDAFKNKKNAPALILKTSGATYSIIDRMNIENQINQIAGMFGKVTLPNIYLVHGDLTDAEMNSLYNHPKVKAMYSLTKAEGFGRPLLEFSTTAKPIIAPHYSGQADFLNKDFICAVNGTLTPIHPSAQNQFLIAEAKWFTPDYKHAIQLLHDVFVSYKNYVENAKRQRYHVNTKFSKNVVESRYAEVCALIKSYTDQIPKQIELKLPKLNKIELPTLQKV